MPDHRFPFGRMTVLFAVTCCVARAAAAGDSKELAREIVNSAGVRGGLIVHVDSGDGKLTAALRVSDRFLVQGLDANPDRVPAARRHVQSLGLSGKVSISTFDGRSLPYADNLVNLVVVSGSMGQVSVDEIERVLCPGGVALHLNPETRNLNPETFVRKPWPDDIDEWTHFLHDASGNAVAHDRVVAAPRRLQWADGPMWSRSHEYDSSLCAMVSAQGRMFSIFDEGPTGIVDRRIPDKWTLIARDAFNGVVLWKRPIPDWGWKAWRPQMAEIDWRRMGSYRCASPLSLPRRLVAAGDRVYTTLGFRAPLVALDAATGETLATYTGTEHTDEILLHDGRLLLCVRPPNVLSKREKDAKRRGRPPARSSKLMAFDADSGQRLWQTDPLPVTVLSPAAGGDSLFCHSGDAVLRLDLATGREYWRTQVGGPGMPLIVFHKVVMCVARKQVVGLSTDDGRQLWQLPAPRGFGVANPPDLFVADGLLWYGQAGADSNRITGYDPVSGKSVRTIDYGPLVTRGHHARCYRSKATDNYLLLPKRAVEFVDLHGDRHSRNNWVRGACRYGVLPCNGMLYGTPHPCFCYAGVKLGGFLALAPAGEEREESGERRAGGGRLEKGPAFDQESGRRRQEEVGLRNSGVGMAAAAPDPSAGIPTSDFRLPHLSSWPAYRHDARRSGSVATVVEGPLHPVWTADVGGKLTQPVVADGRVFVARADDGVVCCRDSATGEPRWDFMAGGRIDSSPTYYRGRLIFGSADGYVYCLRASDGQLAWRFRAAANERRVVAFGQVESAWPVHGSVLMLNDTVYFTAGRSSFLDGGIVIYGLDPLTGQRRYETRMDGPHPDSSALDEAAYAMEGSKSDILVTDGTLIYLFHNAFDAQLNKQPTPVLGQPGVRNLGERQFGEHLFSNAGFLEDSWFSRNQWMLGDHWTAFNFAHQAPKEGQLVVFDDTHAYAVKCFARRNMLSPLFFPATDGYFLVADRRTTRAVVVNPRQQPKHLTWLPQEGKLQKCWNLDVGFARSTPPEWASDVPVRIRAMVRTSNALFAAGPPDVCDPDDPLAALEGRRGAKLLTFDPRNGSQTHEYPLNAPPVFDGLSAAAGRLYLSMTDGDLQCLAGE